MNKSTNPSPGRGRPPSEKKRKHILQAATLLFTEKGFVNTSVDDIAAEADVSKQTVYAHYGSKENLFAVAVAAKCKSSGFDEDLIDLDTPPETLLPLIAQRFLNLMMSRESLKVHAVCTSSADTHPELGALFYEHGPLRTVEVLAKYFRRQHKNGQLKIENPEFAAWQFLSMLKAEAQLRLQFNLQPKPAKDIQRYVDSCVSMFLRAYEGTT